MERWGSDRWAGCHAFPLLGPALVLPELRDTSAESRGHPCSSWLLEATWSLSSHGKRQDPMVTLEAAGKQLMGG